VASPLTAAALPRAAWLLYVFFTRGDTHAAKKTNVAPHRAFSRISNMFSFISWDIAAASKHRGGTAPLGSCLLRIVSYACKISRTHFRHRKSNKAARLAVQTYRADHCTGSFAGVHLYQRNARGMSAV